MSRKPRLEYAGAIYHVFQRGNNREDIFNGPIEKAYFIKQIKEYMNVYDYELFAYVIMDNHYHILLRTNEANLSKIMHSINNIYSKFYNYRHNRTGHVFEERYSSKLVENDAYLIWLLRYIHRNPVRAKMFDKVSEYKWSSDFFYKRNIKSFVNINFILNILSLRRANAMKKYFQLMDEAEDNQDYEYENIKAKFPEVSFKNNIVEYSDNVQ